MVKNKKLYQQFHFWLAGICFLFLLITLPMMFSPPTSGRSAERQGQTAGAIRVYCKEPDRNFLIAPQIHFGNNSFNMEFSVFEWLQGRLSSAVDGPTCDSVEPVSKFFNVLFSAIGILFAGLIASFLWGSYSGIISALLLAGNDLWLRYSTYSMIENRVITCALIAIYFSLRRKNILTLIFWSLTILQKPTIYTFVAPFWLSIELFLFIKNKKAENKNFLKTFCYFFAGSFIGVLYFLSVYRFNILNDLPWIQWTGPRHANWYFGNWPARFEFNYYKHLFLDWIRRTNLLVFIISVACFHLFYKKSFSKNTLKTKLQKAFEISTPFVAGRFFYSFLFYNVYVVHEYYALPVNAGAAVVSGGILGLLFETALESRKKLFIWLASKICGIAVLAAIIPGIHSYTKYFLDVLNPASALHHKDWNQRIFPPLKSEKSLVVLAFEGDGRDLLPLYLAKQKGFVWCSTNPAFAPRKYWQEQGVEYVAWYNGVDPKTGIRRWKVRSINEELEIAKNHGWSSDIKDAWASKPMWLWAQLGSQKFKDPCKKPGDENPQTW